MDLKNTLWNSCTHSHTKMALFMSCLVLLIPSLVFLFISATDGEETMMIISVCVTAAIIMITGAVYAVGRFTALKWQVSNLLFAVAESGFYFTGTANQDSYFSAAWEEITGYSVKPEKNGFATVTIRFAAPADCGSFGKNNSLKMVKIENVETLTSVLESKGIKQFETA